MIIRKAVKKALPTIADTSLDAVVGKLQEDGVETIEDLAYVQESDLSSFLKPNHLRKLLSAFKRYSKYY